MSLKHKHVRSRQLVRTSVHVSDYPHTVCPSDSCIRSPQQLGQRSRQPSGPNVLLILILRSLRRISSYTDSLGDI